VIRESFPALRAIALGRIADRAKDPVAKGITVPFGWLAAEKALKCPAPSFRRMASARIERAVLAVQRKRTL
jgi:hypothetical protein